MGYLPRYMQLFSQNVSTCVKLMKKIEAACFEQRLLHPWTCGERLPRLSA